MLIFISILSSKNSQSFISAGIIHQNIDDFDNSQALHLCFSYMDFSKFGFDFGYAQSFYKAKNKKTGEEKNFSALYLFPTYIIPLNNSTAFKAKAGYAKNESGDDGLGYGVDIIFQVNQKSGFSIGFQKMNREINYFMLNTVYKF
jgi:hypothetical protein